MSLGNPTTELDTALQQLKSVILTLDTKNQGLIEEWLGHYSGYLQKEATFDPLTETLKYDAGTILSVELGYNPGSELGGSHYAVVVEDNAKTSDTIMVIPLGSAKPNKTANWNDVDLGEIPEINRVSGYPTGTKSIAKVSQMRAVSKLRIKAPLKSGDQIIVVPSPQLRNLYNKIKDRFTTKGLNRPTPGSANAGGTRP
ncbi:type II toxin-antitoxin system PemK/MazF family toxin [Paenibacillus agricola]|uniref:Type II toxin-antitoxin system PemK/MazF family toxin n=1 Tax=Paenibacillus agricola TaxID=2716264 RepID=A0ABX0JIF1_9BACL|nr:type II toxin-antitoxin system PemK/MazF family toxin [Paenibacillus agricola]NHN33555.1 type II toxin-antitoxin system PemK/MazF family toxin [Paenibacillus agricola]